MTVRILFAEQVIEKGAAGSPSDLQRKVRAGLLPQPVQVGPRRKGWYEHEIDAALLALPRANFTDATRAATLARRSRKGEA